MASISQTLAAAKAAAAAAAAAKAAQIPALKAAQQYVAPKPTYSAPVPQYNVSAPIAPAALTTSTIPAIPPIAAPLGPFFSEVLPFYQAWEKMMPYAQGEAEAQVNPFVQQQYGRDYETLMNQMAGQGAGRFGGAWGGVGELQASSQANKTAQLLDWIGQRRKGFEELFYNPSQSSYNELVMAGQTPTAPKMPTWNEFSKAYGTTYGGETTTPTGLTTLGKGTQYNTQPIYT